MSDKATPRPWRACSCGKCGQIVSIPADVQVANALCDYAMAHAPLPTEEAQRANLALIVAAVNSYEAHQRAAEALRGFNVLSLVIESAVREMAVRDPRETAHYRRLCEVINEARAALAELDRVTK